jgi:tetratricopeptide (TPR) repeat protein
MPDSAVFTIPRGSDVAVREELERVLRSATFTHSHRIRRFLQFVVEEYMGDRQHRLKEYLIGLEVFGRPESFDPRVDSIVRVEARRLRAKLDEYYAGDGSESALRIQLRKGSYVPLFETAAVARRNAAMANPQRTWRPSIHLKSLASNQENAVWAEEIQRRLVHYLAPEPALRVVTGGPSDYVLDGGIETADGQPRLHLQLKNVADQSWSWSEWVDSAPSDLSFCEPVARSIWRAIAGTESDARCSRRSENPESVTAYLQGLYSLRNNKPQGFTGSIAFFTRAVETDSNYAAAWAALALVLVASNLLDCGDSPETRARALDAAHKAVELNDALPESHLAMAAVHSFFEWRWAEGGREFERAICLDPSSAVARLLYGLQLACRGQFARAQAELDESERLNPMLLATHFGSGWIDALQGNREAAARHYRLIGVLEPDSPWSYLGLGQICAADGKWAAAIAHFGTVSRLLTGRFLYSGCLGYCYAKADRREEARQLLRRLSESAAPSVNFASVYAGLGDTQRAFGCLQQAALNREPSLPLLLLGPEFDALRGETQYRALQSMMGLAASVASAA